MKVLRVLSQDDTIKAKIQKVRLDVFKIRWHNLMIYLQRLCKEVRVWHQLRHKNIVQMYGTVRNSFFLREHLAHYISL